MPPPWSVTITVPCSSCHGDAAALGAPLGGVVEQVGDRALERVRVAGDPPRLGVARRTRGRRAPSYARDGLLDHGGQLDGSTDGVAGVLARQLDQVADQGGHLGDLGPDVGEQLGARLREPGGAAGLGEQVEVGAQRGQRGAQLVAGVGDQLALPVVRGGERGEHRVERRGQPGDLVVALDRDRVEPLGAGDVLDGVVSRRTGRRPLRATAQPASPALIIPARPKNSITSPSRSSIRSVGSSDWARTSALPSSARAPPPPGSAGRGSARCARTTTGGRAATWILRPPTIVGGGLVRHATGRLASASTKMILTSAAPKAHGGDPLAGQRVERLRRARPAAARACSDSSRALHRLHPHRGVRREGDRRHREAHRHRGQQGDPAGQRASVVRAGAQRPLIPAARAGRSRRRARCGAAAARPRPRSCGARSRRRPRGCWRWSGSRSPTPPRG